MKKNWFDITGMVFGNLTAISMVSRQSRKAKTKEIWRLACQCGSEYICRKENIVNGNVTSCGCSSYLRRKRRTQHPPEYLLTRSSWEKMKDRCLNKNQSGYENYGGRGIKIEPSWVSSFANFLRDMGYRPGKEFSIDRINYDGDYSKENCRWATSSEQMQNRKKFKGETSIYTGVSYCKGKRRWVLSICKNRKTYVRYFRDEMSAARAYNEKALELYGPNARLNIIASSQGEGV